ncbi:hypothetical protein L0669_22325 [Flavobacterium bizetiae]|uniref:hypothetical protein n=1 Tax=Flavobacterium bizetiae TaxID=2704140 RepID=UPI0021E958A8|nr:hypothetical protein [Flavobacterium bizetiae]UTN04049.1 hypothetical protein L0669_22325 [Flavobacterium bizetiae]
MKESTYLLHQHFNRALSFKELNDVTIIYNKTISNSNLIIPKLNTIDFMLWAKREKINFGPYQHLTFFEISNRIYSDLVLLKAAEILFKDYHIKSIQLKMSNHSGSDLTIIDKHDNQINGESFNSACSFFQLKMRKELKKFKNKSGIITFNSSALNDINKVFLKRKK